MSAFGDIRAALYSHLAAHQATDVAYDNADYTPPPGATWLRVSLDCDEPEVVTLGSNGKSRLGGVLRIEALAPRGQGAAKAELKAGALINHFRRGMTLGAGETSLTIQRAWEGPPASEDDWFAVPVTVRYLAYSDTV